MDQSSMMTVAEVRDMLNSVDGAHEWTTDQTRRLLARRGALFRCGGRLYTTQARIRDALAHLL